VPLLLPGFNTLYLSGSTFFFSASFGFLFCSSIFFVFLGLIHPPSDFSMVFLGAAFFLMAWKLEFCFCLIFLFGARGVSQWFGVAFMVLSQRLGYVDSFSF